ncbi:MAG: DUF2461 domain-containing protein [Actinobacteria bacterium]|nr:DUF2461 domain-containing protein [Actinomycetota bacterium]
MTDHLEERTVCRTRPCSRGSTPRASVLADLEHTNTKTFFDAHQDTFRDGVVEPAKALVVDLGERLRRTVAPERVADPRVNGSLFRINRDIRFSADKSPYKTHQAIFLWEGDDKKTSPGFYLSVSGQEVGVGYMGIGDLDRWRAAIADDDTGEQFIAALDHTTSTLPDVATNDPALKRVPRSYPADHPRGRWLRHKGFRASLREPLPAAVTEPAFVDWCATRCEAFGPLRRWLVDHVS